MGKVLDRHLERRACVYVRQSSLAQVQHHRESTQRQYRLREHALRLGWPDEQIEVIDDDQGQSGASTGNRMGFQRLVSEVALGQVGAVLGLEVSRLARSCADWYRLLEVAALAGTLIVDEEGVYDPNHYNDRLLLGLKGTLSEAELHFLKQRMIGGRRNKARRGAYRIRLPAGYVWQDGIGIDPDESVREAVEFFFGAFDRLGSALAVARYFEDHRQLFPRRDGWGSLTAPVSWGHLSVSRAATALHNPIYAGVYVYDRNNPQAEDPEDPSGGGRIWIPDTHPGYITLETYERNVARLIGNRTYVRGIQGKGSARDGKGLLQGIALCGVCGRRMYAQYGQGGEPIYHCRSSATHRTCQWVRGRGVDRVVKEVVLETLTEEQLGLALQAFETMAQRARELEIQWENRIESTRYEADKAARRYYQVEPENRLVARTLESDWNARLAQIQQLEDEYRQVRQALPFTITEAQRQRILALADDIPQLWRAPTTRPSQRKRLLRILIEDVTLRCVDEPWSVEVAIRWKTGLVSRHQAHRPHAHPHTTDPAAVARIRELTAERTDQQVAQILNAEGYRTGRGKPFITGRVAHIRQRRGLAKCSGKRNRRAEGRTP